jgi:2-polyprenyl-3-methyl-5-hydroxy-6-metoxy-1,4-benzoquinol methylase
MRTCPICKESVTQTYMKSTAWNNRHKLELKKCTSCGFVYTPTSSCDYETAGNPYVHATKKDLLEVADKQKLPSLVQEIVDKSGLKSGKALDFGCGVGLSALCLQEKGFITYGIESSRAYREKHRELNITCSNHLESLDVPHDGFDLIVMKDVLEHVDNPVELLQTLLSYLKPSGYFYIRVPNIYHYGFHWSIDTKTHINHFSPKNLMTLIEKNNMKKIDFIGVYDISTRVGKLYNFVFWKLRSYIPLYHQISLLYQKV